MDPLLHRMHTTNTPLEVETDDVARYIEMCADKRGATQIPSSTREDEMPVRDANQYDSQPGVKAEATDPILRSAATDIEQLPIGTTYQATHYSDDSKSDAEHVDPRKDSSAHPVPLIEPDSPVSDDSRRRDSSVKDKAQDGRYQVLRRDRFQADRVLTNTAMDYMASLFCTDPAERSGSLVMPDLEAMAAKSATEIAGMSKKDGKRMRQEHRAHGARLQQVVAKAVEVFGPEATDPEGDTEMPFGDELGYEHGHRAERNVLATSESPPKPFAHSETPCGNR